MKKKVLCFAAALLALAICFCGCASGDGMESGESPDSSGGDSAIVADGVDRKIVYTVDMEIETGDVAAVREELLADGKAAGGYVERQNDYADGDSLSSCYIVLRIPTANLDDFVNGAGETGKVRSKRVSSDDITTQYVSASARKAAYEERKAQLTAILEEEGLSAADRIAVIDSVSEVNAALQEIELLLTQYDSLVDYSTVRLDIYKTDVWGIVGTVVAVVLFIGLAAGCLSFGLLYGEARRKNRAFGGQNGGAAQAGSDNGGRDDGKNGESC